MKPFKRINTTTGDYIEDCMFESHPYLMEPVTVTNFDEEGNPHESQIMMYVMEPVEVDQISEDGTVTKVMQDQPALDPQYVEEAPPQGLYLPRYLSGAWGEGGTAPDPLPHDPTVDERLDSLEDVMLFLI